MSAPDWHDPFVPMVITGPTELLRCLEHDPVDGFSLRPLPEPSGWRWVLHNLVAHPLLVLCPPLGRRLHDWSAP